MSPTGVMISFSPGHQRSHDTWSSGVVQLFGFFSPPLFSPNKHLEALGGELPVAKAVGGVVDGVAVE